MSPSENDHALLQNYAATGSQEAFAALVRRHLDLVYSAARRQVRSPELAEEIAQAVFLDLSRAAKTIPSEAPLAAWLYVVTRRTAVDTIRRESRRQAREHAAYEIAAMNSPTTPDWPRVEPLLDEAMESLDDASRSAVLLRYFENKSLREVGEALGTSDDTAQKRVSRAVDQLRAFFLQRGIAITAAGLATDLSAHAVGSAPAALGVSISVTTAAAGHVLLAQGAKALVMTSLQKTSLAAVLTLTVGAGLYEAGMFHRRSGTLQSQRTQVAALNAQADEAQRRRTALGRQTAAVREQITSFQAAVAEAKVAADPTTEAELRAWYDRLDRINRTFAEHPEQKIPELQVLTENDWLAAAQTTELGTPEQLREVLASLRTTGKRKVARQIGGALAAYLHAHNETMPNETLELQPYVNPPLDPAILAHYEIMPGETQQDRVLSEKGPVDLEYDTHVEFGPGRSSIRDALGFFVRQALRDYATANPGQQATEPGQLLPYLKVMIDPSKLLPYLKR